MHRFAVVLGLSLLPALGADWSPRRAADYMDSRQKEWFAWPTANGGAKPCISCHTGLTYLLARPALRRVLGESGPTEYETGLLESLRSRVDKKAPDTAALGVESVMAALFLRTPEAYDRMWSLQIREGKEAGIWKWFHLDLEPWEEPESDLFGASLAALAVNAAPAEYRNKPEVKERMAALSAFLHQPHEAQPLHNHLMQAWASGDEKLRARTAARAFEQQRPDGGWTMEGIGPFKPHPNAPAVKPGSNTYATAFTTYVLMQCGVPASNPAMAKAIDWLRTHQSEHGYWYADSLNKEYKPDSMEIRFMRDAATGFASLALVEAAEQARAHR